MLARCVQAGCACLLLAAAGCTTLQTSDTARTAMEQLLISNAVDQSLDNIAFETLAGQKIFLDATHLDCVDKGYVLGSVRHRALAAGAVLADKAENADLIVEIRSGGVGTNHEDSFVGIPGITMPAPIPIALPDIKFFARETQTATAKIGLVAYDAKSKQAVGIGGLTLASADDNNWSIFGIGPFYSGSVRDEVQAATGEGTLSAEVGHVAQERGYRNSMGEINRVALVNRTAMPPDVAENQGRRTARADGGGDGARADKEKRNPAVASQVTPAAGTSPAGGASPAAGTLPPVGQAPVGQPGGYPPSGVAPPMYGPPTYSPPAYQPAGPPLPANNYGPPATQQGAAYPSPYPQANSWPSAPGM